MSTPLKPSGDHDNIEPVPDFIGVLKVNGQVGIKIVPEKGSHPPDVIIVGAVGNVNPGVNLGLVRQFYNELVCTSHICPLQAVIFVGTEIPGTF